MESVKFCRLRFRPGVAGYHPSTDGDWGRTVMHGLENIETLKKKESGSVEINLECHLVMEFDIKRVWEIISGQSLTLCDCVKKFKDCDKDHLQRNQQ